MILVDIVTPQKKLVEGARVNGVKLPSSTGELTILPGHTDLITLLGTGVLSFVTDGAERKFAVSYGFAEVRKDHVTVLAETAESSQEIDRGRAAKAQKIAEEKLAGTLPEGAFRKYELKLQRAVVRQRVAPEF